MKRIDKSPDIDLRQTNIYRDDLVFIESVLQELKVDRISLKLREFEYDSVSEIPTSQKVSHKMQISSSNPSVYVTFHPMYANISSHDSSLEVQGAIRKIEERLNKRVRLFRHYLTILGAFLGAFLFFTGWIFTLIDTLPVVVRAWAAFVAILAIPLLSVVSIVRFKFYSTIHFEAERGNFFTRNKDQLLVALITAIISVVLTVLITNLFGSK